MRPDSVKWWLIALAWLLLPSPHAAWAQAYGLISGYDGLYRINLDNAQTTRLGEFGFYSGQPIVDVEGLAHAPDGTLYGVADNLKVLLRIDPASGHTSIVNFLRESGRLFDPNANLDVGLAFTCDGRLWMSSAQLGQLWELDPATAEARAVGSLAARLSGLAAQGDQLYGIGSGTAEGLYLVNRQNAQTQRIGSLGAGFPPSASIAFDAQGRLWGSLGFNPPTLRSDLVEIDTRSGAVVSTRAILGPDFAPSGNYRNVDALAIAATPCVPAAGNLPAVASVPGLNFPGQVILAALIVLVGLAFGRRRFQ